MDNALFEGVAVRLRYVDHLAVVLRSWRRLAVYWIIAMMAAIIVWLSGLLDGNQLRLADFPWKFFLVMGLFLSAIFVILTPVLSYWRTNRVLKGHAIITQMLDSGIKVTVPNGEGINYWASLKRVVASETRLLFFVGNCSAYVVPRRCFDDPATFDHWVQAASERFVAAKEAK